MRARRAALLALGVFVAAALIATWPLVLRPGHTIAGGPGDPMLVTVVLAWDADRIAHGLREFWDAPWLFPHRHSIAYSEHLIGVALFTAPIQWITSNPVLTYNVAFHVATGAWTWGGLLAIGTGEHELFHGFVALAFAAIGVAGIGTATIRHRNSTRSATFAVRASGQEDRLPLLFDGNIDTRWVSGDPQDGGEWIEVHFLRRVDVGRVRFDTAPRSVMDYPRRLAIDSLDESRTAGNLFEDGVVDRLIASLAADELHAPVVIGLPRNRTATLRIRQTARGSSWWSIHELRLWERPAKNGEKLP